MAVIVPAADDRDAAHRVIYDELCVGVFRDESRATLLRVIDALAAAGAEGVVLGCTEIELLVRPEDTPVAVFPSTALHVRSVVDAALR